jgi:hypothetical protein
VILLQLRFETAEKSEGVGGGTGESCEDFVVVQAADLLRRMFNDGLAERNLAVTGKHYAAIPANG